MQSSYQDCVFLFFLETYVLDSQSTANFSWVTRLLFLLIFQDYLSQNWALIEMHFDALPHVEYFFTHQCSNASIQWGKLRHQCQLATTYLHYKVHVMKQQGFPFWAPIFNDAASKQKTLSKFDCFLMDKENCTSSSPQSLWLALDLNWLSQNACFCASPPIDSCVPCKASGICNFKRDLWVNNSFRNSCHWRLHVQIKSD